MLKVNFKDGTTLAFDLIREDDVQQWLEWSSVRDFQERITGIGIIHNKKYYALPYPKNFRRVRFEADIVHNIKDEIKRLTAERLTCIADDVKMILTVYIYENPPPPITLKLDMLKMKRRRWEPEFKEEKNG